MTVHNTGSEPRDSLTVVRAIASAVWNSSLDGQPFAIVAGDDTARRGAGAVVPAGVARSTSVNTDMTTEPDQIRAQIAALLAELPDVDADDAADVDIDGLAARLEEAHDLLVYALESVEKSPAASETPDG